MEFNLITNLESCYLAVQQTPTIIYYSHILTITTSLIFGFFVFLKNRDRVSTILLSIVISFSLWSTLDLITWTSLNGKIIMYAWSLFGLLDASFFILSLYFIYVFIDKKDISFFKKILLGSLLLPIIAFTPTTYNVSHFIVQDCEVADNYFFDYIFYLEIFILIWIIVLAIKRYAQAERKNKKQVLLTFFGVLFFLGSFLFTVFISKYLISNNIVDSTSAYNFEQYGLFGMAFFIGVLAYMIVEFKAFNIKLLGVQALVVTLVILIGSQFAFIRNSTNRILTGVTLSLAIGFGWFLIRSVKKEVKQREELEIANQKISSQNEQLEVANLALKKADEAKNEFINIASHQLRTPVTVIKGTIAMLIDGTMNSFDAETKKRFYEGARFKCKKLEDIINDILSASSLTNKKFSVMDQEAEKIDIREFFSVLIDGFRPETLEREIELTIGELDADVPAMFGQKKYLEEAFSNLITNAIKYTPSAKQTIDIRDRRDGKALITISSHRAGNDIVFSIKDNGIGIPEEEISKLFQKFSRAENAKNMYTDGTGLGLFIVKEIIEGHGGKVWVESVLNEGSQFFIQLPINFNSKVDIKEYIRERADMQMLN